MNLEKARKSVVQCQLFHLPWLQTEFESHSGSQQLISIKDNNLEKARKAYVTVPFVSPPEITGGVQISQLANQHFI